MTSASADQAEQSSAPGHPSPHRTRVSLPWLFVALVGAPLAWSVQISLGYGLAAYACYPKRDSLPAPVLPHLHLALTLLSAAAIGVALLCALIAWRSWCRTRDETGGDSHHLAEVGEGRSRFMSLCALITSVGFAFALLATSAVLLIGSPCGL